MSCSSWTRLLQHWKLLPSLILNTSTLASLLASAFSHLCKLWRHPVCRMWQQLQQMMTVIEKRPGAAPVRTDKNLTLFQRPLSGAKHLWVWAWPLTWLQGATALQSPQWKSQGTASTLGPVGSSTAFCFNDFRTYVDCPLEPLHPFRVNDGFIWAVMHFIFHPHP